MPAEELHAFLNEREIAYETHEHRRVVDAQRLAAEEDISGWDVAKPVLLSVGDRLVMAVVPAAVQVDVAKASRALGGNDVRLATEEEFRAVFDDSEVGAEPPFGNLYDIPVFLDEQLRARSRMLCRDGSHTESIILDVNDYVRAVQPEIADLATAAT